MNNITNFEQNIKEYLLKERNEKINEKTIWIIIQLYKKKKKITGKKKKKNNIISFFCTFINNREKEGRKNTIQEQGKCREEDHRKLRTAEVNEAFPTVVGANAVEKESFCNMKFSRENKRKTQKGDK